MFSGLFSLDSKLMRALSRVADLAILNLLFLVTSLPVVTIGPAVTALYSVTFFLGTSREKGVLKPYFQAFRENFGTSIRVYLIFLGVCAALILDLVLCSNLGGWFGTLSLLFWPLLILAMLAAAMAFPWISLFQNTTMETLKNALILALAQLPRALIVLAMWVFPLFLLVRFPIVFFNASYIILVIYFSAAAYISGLILRKLFVRYMPENIFKEEVI